jgi:protein-tyrosine phosphatase
MNDKIIPITKSIFYGSFLHPIENSIEFISLGIDVIFNCTDKVVYYESRGIIIENYPIPESDYNTFIEMICEINNKILMYRKNNKKIYIHCYSGLCISPSILIYYLINNSKYCTYDDAYSVIKRKIKKIDIDYEFRDYLIESEPIQI